LSTVAELQQLVIDFVASRGWNQEPKDLAMSVAIEAAEVMEHYQWTKTGERLPADKVDELALECADVLWYLLRLADAESIDLASALKRKAEINAGRFPAKAP
jgi:NTP pyrophosphatase (non-canonical NTP hydrolase)